MMRVLNGRDGSGWIDLPGRDRYEDLLAGVLGVFGVAEEPQRQAVDRVLSWPSSSAMRACISAAVGVHSAAVPMRSGSTGSLERRTSSQTSSPRRTRSACSSSGTCSWNSATAAARISSSRSTLAGSILTR
jgi:hypothetical protein